MILAIIQILFSIVALIIHKKVSKNIGINNGILKYMIRLLIINIVLMYLYKGIKYILAKNGLIVRVWTYNIYYFIYAINILLVVLIIFYLFSCIMEKSLVLGVFGGIGCIITLLIAYIMCALMVLGYVCDYDHEYEVFEYNRNLIASVGDHGFHHTIIIYYEPVNFIVMKPSDIESEIYDGCYDNYYMLKEME